MHIFKAILLSGLVLSATPFISSAQEDEDSEDLMAILDKESAPQERFVRATFKTTRVVTGHSIETTGKGVLDFRVNHRFGPVSGGVSSFFGLDDANTRIGFDYGVTDWLSIGIGRSTFMKEYDGFIKAKLLRQKEGGGMPISLAYVGAMSIQGLPKPNLPAGQEYYFSNRLYYVNQLIIAKKFNQWLSVQLMPTHIHYNLVPTTPESNDLIAIGVGGRVKLSNRLTLNAEYYYRIPGTEQKGTPTAPYYNVLALGLDIETGGHVFQLMLTNSRAMTERAFIGQTQGDWGQGDIHFGFNISRVFTIVRPKGFEDSRNKIW